MRHPCGVATVLVGNLPDEGKTQSRPRRGPAGCAIERGKDALPLMLGDARPPVADGYHGRSCIEPHIKVDGRRSVPLGIVVTELITNAVKYAFPPPRSGTVNVKANRHPSGRVDVVIKDDGAGIVHMREGSLGFDLVRSRARSRARSRSTAAPGSR